MRKRSKNRKSKRARVVPAPDTKAALSARGPLEERLRAIGQAASTGGLIGPNAKLTVQVIRMETELALGKMRAEVALARIAADREHTEHLRLNAQLRREQSIGYPVGKTAKAAGRWVGRVLDVAAPVDGAKVNGN